jgi:phosphate transport system substrate-binding protein
VKRGWVCRLVSRAAGIALAASASFTPAAAENLTIQGSTTFNTMLLGPHRVAIETASGHSLAVIPNKSSLGLVALMEGRADLAMISTSLQSELALLKKNKPDLPFAQLRNFNVSRTRVAFAVHPNNPVRTTEVDAIRRVLRGEIDNWRTLGGPDLPLRVVMVRDGGGVTLTVENVLLRGEHMAPRNPITVVIGSEVPKVVAREPGALGLAQLAELQARKLPELVIDTEIEQQLNLVTLGNPSGAAWDVISAMQSVAAKELHAAN